ncbi:hypothetical protein BV25DRAFT_1832254 [Artomyces pyxidatus]|uniref:Uncharacterized protein n=1 Tax=Artomyces pyxidatus TaxID=48021 RepID=A0ACB8SIQ4_9AGAM|nr:hypothetical protein BV25DRAFT_1832254 [Artomyces pyxidatus]
MSKATSGYPTPEKGCYATADFKLDMEAMSQNWGPTRPDRCAIGHRSSVRAEGSVRVPTILNQPSTNMSRIHDLSRQRDAPIPTDHIRLRTHAHRSRHALPPYPPARQLDLDAIALIFSTSLTKRLPRPSRAHRGQLSQIFMLYLSRVETSLLNPSE